MSKFYYTSTELLASIKRRCLVPESQTTFSDQDFLDFATEEMNMGIVPTVLQLHQDYYLDEQVVSLVTDQLKYDVPYRAIGNKLRDICRLDGNNNRFLMTRENIADQVYTSTIVSDKPYSYFMSANEINLMTTNTTFSSEDKLAISYFLRPNSLVPSDKVGVITAINTITGQVTLSSMPTAFTTALNYDFIQTKSPHRIMSYDKVASAVNTVTKVITFTATDLPSKLAVGDRIALATETDIPQIPSDMHVMLAVRVASRILEALGDTEALASSNQKLAELEIKTTTLIDNRVDDAPVKIVNRFGTLRRNWSK